MYDSLSSVRQVATSRLLVFFFIFFIIGQVLRWLAKNYVRRKHQPIVLDLATTFTLYGYTIGCNYIHRIYGLIWYLVATASVGVGHAFLLCPTGTTGNPVTHVVVSSIACDTPIQKLLLRIGVHLAGSLVCHPLATLLWQTLMADLSCPGLHPEMHCMGHGVKGQSVHVAMVLGMELLGTLVVGLMTMKTCRMSADIYETVAKVLLAGLLHGSGKDIPAIYLNPVMASTQLLGCSDKDVIEHVMVYWVGPLVGASFAVYSTFCSQATQRKRCHPCVTFDECPATESSQPCRPSSQPCRPSSRPCRPSDDDSNCEICGSKSRSNSSRPCRCSFNEDDDYEEECCEDAEPSACRPSGCGITAQVRQTAVNGSKQLAYLFDIPPTVCRKGLRLRHNILVTKKPKYEPDNICCDNWTDSTASNWRACLPLPKSPRDTCPEFESDAWRRSCCEGRDRSRSPACEPDSCLKYPFIRGPSEVGNIGDARRQHSRSTTKDDLRRKSSRNLVEKHRKHSEHDRHHAGHSVRKSHSRHSVKRGDSRRTSPRVVESKHSRHTIASKKSHTHHGHDVSRGPSRQTYVGARDTQMSVVSNKKSRADVDHNKLWLMRSHWRMKNEVKCQRLM